MSLALSGILLLSNVPVQALATEAVTVQEIPAAVAPVAAEGANPTFNYPLIVNENDVTNASAGDILGDGTVSFEHSETDGVKTNTLTLNNAELSDVSWGAFEGRGADLIICLPEGTKSVISGKLSSDGTLAGNITITGKGTLTVGSISAGGNLTIADTRVCVGGAVRIKDQIEVSGEAHLVTAAAYEALVFKNGAGTVSAGYWRNAKDSDFTDAAAAGNCDTYFELVSTDHLTEEKAAHVFSCRCDNATEVIKGAHDPGYSVSGAVLTCVCSVCEKNLGALTVKEPADLTWDGQKKEVVLENSLPYSEGPFEVKYHKDGIEKDAVEPGTYVAVVTVPAMGENYELRKTFTIKQKELKDTMVTLSSETAVYDSTPHSLPTVTVTNGTALVENTDYSVAYTRGGSAVDEPGRTNAGTIQVTVTGKGNYTGTVTKTFTIQQADAAAGMFECTMPTDLTYNGQAKKAAVKVRNGVRGMGDVKLKYYRNGVAAEPVDAGNYEVAVCVEGNGNYKQAEIKDAAWTFTIAAVPVTNSNSQPVPEQTVVACYGAMALKKPSFTGTNGETVTPENVTYSLEGAQNYYTYDQLIAKLKTLAAGETVKISYSVVADGNYSGTITGEMVVHIVDLEFTVDGETATAENAVTILEEEKRVYGQEGIVTVKNIVATAGNKTDAAPVFAVKYNGGQDEPVAGDNTFCVMYSGNIDGVAYENIEVCRGNVTVAKRAAAPQIAAVTGLTDREEDQGKEMLTVTTKGEKVKYSVNNGAWTDSVPTVKESGVYMIRYKVENTSNIIGSENFEAVKVVVVPYLTATYGETLETVQSRITTSQGTWTFNSQNPPAATKVGNVNEEGNTFYIDFTPKNPAEATATNQPVKIFVEAAHIRVKVEVNDRHLPDADGQKVEATVTVKDEATNTVIPAAEYTTACTNITNTADTEVINPGKAKITVQDKPGGNYIFDNGAAELSKEYIVYDNNALKLLDAWVYAAYGNDDMAAAGLPTGEEVREALDKALETDLGELEKADYPVTKRKYYDFLMKEKSDLVYTYDPMYWPNDGLEGKVAYINADADNTDTFKVFAIYTVDSEELGTTAGTVIELKEATGTTVGVNEYKKNASTISVNLKNYAAVCIALKENEEKQYSVTAKSEDTTTGTVKFTGGTLTTANTSGKAKKGDTITVTVSPKSGYELSRLIYTYNDGSKDVTVAIDKDSNSKYTFKMPAASVVINAKFVKKQSNASTGDTSNIGLWVTMLAASGVAILALMAFWFKKRKK